MQRYPLHAVFQVCCKLLPTKQIIIPQFTWPLVSPSLSAIENWDQMEDEQEHKEINLSSSTMDASMEGSCVENIHKQIAKVLQNVDSNSCFCTYKGMLHHWFCSRRMGCIILLKVNGYV